MSLLFEKNLTCNECGKELVRVYAGLVCPDGHGKIKPIGETQDLCFFPINKNGAGVLSQKSARQAGLAIARAIRADNKRQQQLELNTEG